MKRIVSIIVILTLLGSLGLIGAGCTKVVESNVGTLEIWVTDAPPEYDIESIDVTVSQIDIHRAGDEENNWMSIEITGDSTFDLLQLQASDLEELLAEAEVGVGKYTQVRLTFGTVDTTMGDGSEPPEFVLPSGELKFVHPFEIFEGETTILLLDFDADKSIVETGADKIIFKPVVKLIIEQGGTEPATTTVTTTEAE
ncbi:DUF4382 domain-containing protein [Chloroflexota bacterium]